MNTSVLNAAFRAFALAYFIFLNWQLLTPVTLVQAGGWDKLYHFAAFFVLAVVLCAGWQRRSVRGWILALLAYAALTEILQHFIPGRSFSVMDWVADAVGVGAGMFFASLLETRWPSLLARVHGTAADH